MSNTAFYLLKWANKKSDMLQIIFKAKETKQLLNTRLADAWNQTSELRSGLSSPNRNLFFFSVAITVSSSRLSHNRFYVRYIKKKKNTFNITGRWDRRCVKVYLLGGKRCYGFCLRLLFIPSPYDNNTCFLFLLCNQCRSSSKQQLS